MPAIKDAQSLQRNFEQNCALFVPNEPFYPVGKTTEREDVVQFIPQSGKNKYVLEPPSPSQHHTKHLYLLMATIDLAPLDENIASQHLPTPRTCWGWKISWSTQKNKTMETFRAQESNTLIN